MQAVILVGGLGTRLRPVLADRPKCLAPVRGRPFLAWVLDDLAAAGFDTVCLATGHLGEQIRDTFGERHAPPPSSRAAAPLSIVYSHEDTPLGTGGAVRQALRALPARPSFVLNGDTFVRPDWSAMAALHRARASRLTIAIRHVDDVARYGAVTVEGDRIVGFGEKSRAGPGWISAGVYLMEPDLLDADTPDAVAPAAASFSLETAVIAAHLARLRPVAYPSDSPFLDIGIPDDLARADAFLDAYLPPPGPDAP